MHKLFEKQLQKATRADGTVDVARLSELVSDAYRVNDRTRERTERSIALMVEELEERHQEVEGRELALSAQNTLFKDAIENIGHGLSMYDSDNRLVVCNQAYIAMYQLENFGIRPGIEADRIRDHFHQSGLFATPVRRVADMTSDNGEREDEYLLTDGRVISVSRHTRIGGGWVMMHKDITETRQLERERAAAEEDARLHRELEYKAEMSNKAKSEFLAIMSHEIRTPLNAVLGLTTTLLDTDLSEGQRESLEMIDTSGSNLLHLLNDILDFSKLDAGRMEFEAQPFSPQAVVDSAFSIARVPAAKKSLDLRIEIGAGLPEGTLGDADRIRQVIYNLATNAVKFTDKGEVVIGAREIARGDGHATVEYWVRDTGIGISAEKIGRLFQNFTQADETISRRFGGTGLGLAICKKLVEKMGGDISVTSEQGLGSTFSFRLSLPLADLAEEKPDERRDTVLDLQDLLKGANRPVRILLAEDNATNQLVFRKMLEEFGLQIHIASNGLEAVERVDQVMPDIIYMDMQMPEMNGVEATVAIRAKGGAFANIPIIAISANAFPDDIRAYREAGMVDFIAKPVRKRQLVENISRYVQSMTSGLAVAAAPSSTAAAATTEMVDIDHAAFEELGSEIGADCVEMALEIFFSDNRPRVEALAVPLDEANRGRIRSEAHALKGAAGMFGFKRLSTLAQRLEKSAATISPQDYEQITHALCAAMEQVVKELDGMSVEADAQTRAA